MYEAKKVLVTGATGFVGKNVIAELERRGYQKIIPVSSKEYNLLEQGEVRRMFREISPEIVLHFAAHVGGILVNKECPSDFIYQNLTINTQVIDEAAKQKVEKFLTCIGGCSYPSNAENPIKEESLFTGMPARESAPYALAKAMSFVQLQSYRKQHGLNGITLVPGNIYGPHDNFRETQSHVIPGLIRRLFDAKTREEPSVIVWGTGKPVRDFAYIEDVAEAIAHALETYDDSDLINISSGTPTSIRELVDELVTIIGYKGELVWDTTKPDGQQVKIFDTTRMRTVLKYECKTPLRRGLEKTVLWFEQHQKEARR